MRGQGCARACVCGVCGGGGGRMAGAFRPSKRALVVGGAGAYLKLIASIEKKELRDVRAPHAPNRSALTAH